MEYIEHIIRNSPTFLFVFVRTGSIVLLGPVFGTPTIPLFRGASLSSAVLIPKNGWKH